MFVIINAIVIASVVALTKTMVDVPEMAISWECSVNGKTYESYLGPIAILFLVVFGIITVIQILCMLIHRMFTFTQKMAATSVFGKADNSENFVEAMKADCRLAEHVAK